MLSCLALIRKISESINLNEIRLCSVDILAQFEDRALKEWNVKSFLYLNFIKNHRNRLGPRLHYCSHRWQRIYPFALVPFSAYTMGIGAILDGSGELYLCRSSLAICISQRFLAAAMVVLFFRFMVSCTIDTLSPTSNSSAAASKSFHNIKRASFPESAPSCVTWTVDIKTAVTPNRCL